MNDVASLLLWSLGRTTLWLAAATLVTAFVLRIARPTWPAAHRLAWLVVLLVGWSFIRLPVAVPWYETQRPEPRASVELALSELLVDEEMPAVDIAPILDQPSEEVLSTTPVAIADAPVIQAPVENREIDWPFVLLGAWALGAGLLVCAWAVGYVLFVRSLEARVPVGEVQQAEWRELLAAAGVRREIPLSMTESFGPLLCRLPRGFEIIVPESLWRELTARERTAILRHELAHYQRGDVWTSLVARLLALPHWFNPAAWWAARQFDEAAEWACDRVAAGDDATTDYASALVRLGQVGPRATFYGTAARGRSLAARIRRVLAGPSTEDPLVKKASLVALVLGLAAASTLQIELVAQQPSGEKKAESQAADDRNASTGPTVSPYLNLLQGKDEAGAQPAKTPVTEAAPAPNKPQRTASETRAQKMVDKARETYESNLAAYESENVTMDKVYDWSMRWMRAAQIAAVNDQENVAAIQAHLDRMRELQKRITALFNIASRGGEARDMRAVNFYVAEAERWLADAEVPATHRGGDSSGSAKAAEETRVVDLKITISEIEKEIAQAEVDLSVAKEMLHMANNTKQGNDKVSTAELYRLMGDYQKSKLQLDYLHKRLALHRDKLKLISSEPGNQPAKTEPAVSKTIKPEPADRGVSRVAAGVRFKDKDFDSWVEVLHNELSAERRSEAMHAVATFGANGYGPQAARYLIEIGRGFPLWLKAQDQATQELTGMAVGAFKIIPAQDSLPLVLKSLESEHAGERLFAVNVLPEVSPNRKETAQRLTAMLKDTDADVRQAAVGLLIVYEPIPPEFVATLREWLASDDVAQVSFATRAAKLASRGQRQRESEKKLLVELLPDLLKAIERPEPYGNLVEQSMGVYDASVASIITEAIESAGAQPGPRTQQLLENLLKKNKKN